MGTGGRRENGQVMAHRATFEFFITEIPEGLVLDHQCRTRNCVNPWHLDPVTPKRNTETRIGRCPHCAHCNG